MQSLATTLLIKSSHYPAFSHLRFPSKHSGNDDDGNFLSPEDIRLGDTAFDPLSGKAIRFESGVRKVYQYGNEEKPKYTKVSQPGMKQVPQVDISLFPATPTPPQGQTNSADTQEIPGYHQQRQPGRITIKGVPCERRFKKLDERL